MQTASDADLELIFSLGDELEKKCESIHHKGFIGPINTGFDNFHPDGGPLWYVNFTKGCHCFKGGLSIRCNSWAMRYRELPNVQINCSCGDTWAVVVLEPVGEG